MSIMEKKKKTSCTNRFSFDDFAEYNMLVIEVRRGRYSDEKLRSIRVGTRVGLEVELVMKKSTHLTRTQTGHR